MDIKTVLYVQAGSAAEKHSIKRQILELRAFAPEAELILDIGAKTKDTHSRKMLREKLAAGERMRVYITQEAELMKKVVTEIKNNGGDIYVIKDGEPMPWKEEKRSYGKNW